MKSIEQSNKNAEERQTDLEVLRAFTGSLHSCFQLDKIIADKCGTEEANRAVEAFDRHIDKVLVSYADLVLRGVLTGLEERLQDAEVAV